MVEQAEELHARITPARVLIGSLLVGTGLTVLGFLLGGSPASATEPAPPHSPVGALVSTATGTAGTTVGSISGAAAAALPAPVDHVVTNVVTNVVPPVADTVDRAADQSPVSSTVNPVVSGVDGVVTQVPVVHDVLPPAPVSSVSQPVTGSADQAVGDVAHAVDTGVAPLTPSAPANGPGVAPEPVSGPADGTVIGIPAAASAGQPLVAPNGASSRLLGHRDRWSSDLLAPLRSAPTGPAPGPNAPPALPGGGTSGDSPGGGNGPGGPAPGVAAAIDGLLLPPSAWMARTGASEDDTVPAGPAGDHDISPD